MQYIEADPRSRARLEQEAGIARSSLYQFMHEKNDLALVTINRLCNTLGLELRPRAKESARDLDDAYYRQPRVVCGDVLQPPKRKSPHDRLVG